MTSVNKTLGGADRHVLLYRDFGLFWACSLLSTTGMWMWRILAPILIFEMTASAMMLGVISMASYGPLLLFSFAGGIVADKFPRKWVISTAHCVTFSVFATLAVAAGLGALSTKLILLCAVLEGTAYSMAKPSLQSMIYMLVHPDRLAQGVAANTSIFTTAQLIGPALASYLLLAAGPSPALIVSASMYLPIIVTIHFLRTRPNVNSETTSPKNQLHRLFSDGIIAIRGPVIARLLLIVAVGSIIAEGGLRVLAPQFVSDALGQNESIAGIIISAHAVGASIVILFVQMLVVRWNQLDLSIAGFLVLGLGLTLYSRAWTLPIAIAAALIAGAGWALTFSVVTALLHRDTPDNLRGRVMGVHAMALLGLRPVAGLLAGAMSTVMGSRMTAAAFALPAVLGIALAHQLKIRMPGSGG